jgi:hypothetical protein
MISLEKIKIKDLLRSPFNLRELDLLVADRIMKEVTFFKNKTDATISARLILKTFSLELKEPDLFDAFGDLKWTKGNDTRYFTQNLPRYSEELSLALQLTKQFPDYKTQMKELEHDLYQFSYIHKKTKDSITIQAATEALAICFASLYLESEFEKKPKLKLATGKL